MDDIPGELDELIRETVVGRTVMSPVTISDLLLEIDYRIRIRPDGDELDAAIRRVVDAGWVRHAPDGSLVDGRSIGRVFAQDQPSEDGLRAIVEPRRPRAEDGTNPEPPTEEQLRVTVAVAGHGQPTPDDWRIAEELAYQMCKYLGDRGRATRVVTLKTRPGRIEFSVLGHATSDPRRLRRMVLPLFEAMAPPGSSLVARQ